MGIKEIRERWEKATRGPWYQHTRFPEAIHSRVDDEIVIEAGSFTDANLEFIANSWSDIEFLLGEVERLNKLLQEAQECQTIAYMVGARDAREDK